MLTPDKKIDSPDMRIYARKMGELVYSTYYEVAKKHGRDPKPWGRLNKENQRIWIETADRLMRAANVAERDVKDKRTF